MKILRAEHLGMCFGVRDAIALALDHAATQPLTILGDLVHNQTVMTDLQRRGIRVAQQPADATTSTVMVTAHGASDKARASVRALGLNVLEATCPLVHVAHRALAKLVAAGFHPVIIGKRGHVEVRGLTEDYPDFDIVLSDEDVAQLRARPRFGVVAQTTQPIERVKRLVAAIRQRFPHAEVRFVDTVCQPTKQRQHAAVELAQRCDVVVVIGGINSNNTRELVATCQQHCARVHHVQTAADLCEEWFFTAGTVGITAGTSTPDAIIDGVEQWLQLRADHHAQVIQPERQSSGGHPACRRAVASSPAEETARWSDGLGDSNDAQKTTPNPGGKDARPLRQARMPAATIPSNHPARFAA